MASPATIPKARGALTRKPPTSSAASPCDSHHMRLPPMLWRILWHIPQDMRQDIIKPKTKDKDKAKDNIRRGSHSDSLQDKVSDLHRWVANDRCPETTR